MLPSLEPRTIARGQAPDSIKDAPNNDSFGINEFKRRAALAFCRRHRSKLQPQIFRAPRLNSLRQMMTRLLSFSMRLLHRFEA